MHETNRISLFNTASRKLEEWKPLVPKAVKMYHCGPTVYAFPHIGNMRSYILADTLRRLFEGLGYKVTQVINITDVGHLTTDADEGEDKIEKSAKAQNKTAKEITDFYTKAFFDDLASLNVRTEGTIFPRASEHINEQIALIQSLEKRGHVYRTSDGLYFDTSTFKEYGSLGEINLQGQKPGARVEQNPEKRNPHDFALWKFSQKQGERMQEWQSPWGLGFPGWHIECSAMSMKYLGEEFDIHTGGIDHIPVHHNNEIAQSVCSTGKKYAKYWLHNAFMTIDKQKMSKSEGNAFTVTNLIQKGYSPLSLRYFFLSASYRMPVTFTDEAIKGAHNALVHLYEMCESLMQEAVLSESIAPANAESESNILTSEFDRIISNDLNTAEALAHLWNTLRGKCNIKVKIALIEHADKFLGLKLAEVLTLPPQDIHRLISEREIYRSQKDFIAADKIKNVIVSKGYYIKDTPLGPVAIRQRNTW